MSHLSEFRTFWKLFFYVHSIRNAVLSGEQKKQSIIRVRVGQKNPSHAITVCHQWASLVMPIGDPWDGFVYPTLTLMKDSYSLLQYCKTLLFRGIKIFAILKH